MLCPVLPLCCVTLCSVLCSVMLCRAVPCHPVCSVAWSVWLWPQAPAAAVGCPRPCALRWVWGPLVQTALAMSSVCLCVVCLSLSCLFCFLCLWLWLRLCPWLCVCLCTTISWSGRHTTNQHQAEGVISRGHNLNRAALSTTLLPLPQLSRNLPLLLVRT